MENENNEIATFGTGCFWCTEAFFRNLEGVVKVKPGYSGGHIKNPAYREVCSGRTGHAEVIQITFNPDILSYESLLEVFLSVHDPTSLNRQGADVGTQYRSVIFYHTEKQKQLAELALKAADESGVWSDKIVTEISPMDVFYPAENEHDNFYEQNMNHPYCQAVIRPKMDRFKANFSALLKKEKI